MSRKTPDISVNCQDGYAVLLANNWDTVQESFKVNIPQKLVERLESAKNAAIERHEGQGIAFNFGGQIFQIWSGASQGNKWVIENDDVQLHFGPPSRNWPVTVRYLAPGLWEHGYQAVKDRVVKILEIECEPIVEEGETIEDWCRLSRADFAFDFYSPAFTEEMRNGLLRAKFVLTSGVKGGMYWEGERDETITIGSKSAALQIQVYDKGKEITDISGKTWMFKVWAREGYYPPEDERAKNVWRVEFRFRKDFLKDRNLRSMAKLSENLSEVLAEAIMSRRLVTPSNDNHRERWPLHPLWAELYEASGQSREYVPIGRQIMMRRDEYKEMLRKQSNGIVRAMDVLENGHYSDRRARSMAYRWTEDIEQDEKHEDKVMKNVEKFRYFDEAQ